jgi:hypothetical protein
VQELAATKEARRAAEATASKLAAEKAALLKELAFGSAAASRGEFIPGSSFRNRVPGLYLVPKSCWCPRAEYFGEIKSPGRRMQRGLAGSKAWGSDFVAAQCAVVGTQQAC